MKLIRSKKQNEKKGVDDFLLKQTVDDLEELVNNLLNENEQLKDELDSANNEIGHCHMIIETLVADAGVTDYNDLLNNCDKDILKEMGWK